MPSKKLPVLSYERHKYGPHDLQRFGAWARQIQNVTPQHGYWIVFLHGGAWRDPRNTFEDFTPCVEYINSLPSAAGDAIQGFISLDHRLSSHPDFPQSPESTAPSTLRAAKHPEHLQDVYSALALAQDIYAFQRNYIFVGHSSGATIGYQLFMGSTALSGEPPSRDIHLPSAVIAVYGIYDLVGLNGRYEGNYSSFLEGAFGRDHDLWRCISPSCFSGDLGATRSRSGDVVKHGLKYTIVADSPDDNLLDSDEVEAMRSKLVSDGVKVRVVDNLVGDHDFVWKDASQLAQLVQECLAALD